MEVAVWLRRLGLERYEATFRNNEIDWEALPKLTAEDLKDLGVLLGSHRRKLLEAIAALQGETTAADHRATASPAAERRQLTVMFCDLVGSTALSSRLDPEDLREVIAAYHRAVADAVRSFDGFVAKYMGDGVLIYFGYPRAHEDDAERAVRAGLGVVDAVGRLDVRSVNLQARVGIATGLVVVGDLIGQGSAQEQSVVGETPNLAARLQALAEPETVIIAAATRRLVGDLFECRDLGAVEVKGIAGPLPAWRVLRPSVVESRFEALRGAALTRLVGRDEEVDLLLRWARAKAGDGQVVLVSGEPGLGKSRLAAALAEHLHAEPYLRLRYFCSPYHQDSALHPFIHQLGQASGLARDDAPASRLEKLEAVLALAAPPDEDVAFLADLLSLPASDHHPLPNLSPQRKKEKTLEALIRQLEGLARWQPVVMVFEDAHWIDPTSRELLDLTVKRVPSLPVLLIVTFRPEFQPPWTGQPQVTMLALNRLDRQDRTALVAQIAGGKALPEEVIDQIVDRTDGVPLFVEELTKSVLESGLLREEGERYVLDGALPPFAIPTTLHDSLMARLDRLASVRHVAQIGAAIGREFSYALLHAVSRLPEDELQTALARLVASELVFQRGTPPDAVYTFKHALVQDAAYGTLLRSRRQQLHARIGLVLETEFPDTAEGQPALLAHHFTEAGLVERAVEYWLKAGRHALTRSAMSEAEALLRKGLTLVASGADDVRGPEHELALLICLGQALFATKGWAAAGVTEAYARARQLCDQLGNTQRLLPILYGQWINHAMRGDMDRAQELAADIRQLGEEQGSSIASLMGFWASGFTSLHLGEFSVARVHLERGIELFDPLQRRQYLELTPIDALVFLSTQLCLAMACCWVLNQAQLHRDQGISEARHLAHAHTLAAALYFSLRAGWATRVHPERLLQETEELQELVAEQGFPHWAAQAAGLRGWCTAALGQPAQGIRLLAEGLQQQVAVESTLYLPHGLTMLADAHRISGDAETALVHATEAKRLAEATQVKWVLAETLRLRGDLLLIAGDRMPAKASYCDAIALARRQRAKLFELRAATSLARLWRDEGKAGEARDLLAPIYGWFTEGFDTQDLKEAKALLDALG